MSSRKELLSLYKNILQWDKSFEKTQDKLVVAARQAKQQITEGKGEPMDYDKLLSLLLSHLFGRNIIPFLQKFAKQQGKLIVYGLIILFIHLYILNLLIVRRIFGQLELLEIIVLLEFCNEIRLCDVRIITYNKVFVCSRALALTMLSIRTKVQLRA